MDLLTTEQKINFLADFYTSVVEKEFDDDILNFLAQEVDNAAVRKKEANERRRLKRKKQKSKKPERILLNKQMPPPEQLQPPNLCYRKLEFPMRAF